jgi:uncharacterized membrane protein HdeD (DUF308 family)
MSGGAGVRTAPASVAKSWMGFVALGAVMVLLGVIAWVDAVSITIATKIVVGASLLVGGVFQIL